MNFPFLNSYFSDKNFKIGAETLIQTFHGKQVLLYTPLAKFYLELGMQLTNITLFLQYRPGRVLDDFVQKITTGRIAAKKAGNASLELAYKIIGNS